MTTRYRVEYALKTHRRDQFIEWIKGLLAVPFVLHSQPTGVFETRSHTIQQMAEEAHRRYAEIMKDVEVMIDDHIAHQKENTHSQSKLKLLVPTIGTFFTRLPLADAFKYQDSKRFISSRRFVAPSFNDIRLVLNTAQLMGLVSGEDGIGGGLDLATFDGDVTLYDDGKCLEPSNPVISRLIYLLSNNTKIGIVTAAGYTEASRYHARLYGLLDAINTSTLLNPQQKENLIVMGGESNFLFVFDPSSPHLLRHIPRRQWIIPSMNSWNQTNITALLDLAEVALKECVANLKLEAQVLRKERAVGIIPVREGQKFARESLEETVLVVQKKLEMSEVGRSLPFCAFNGGNDVFVDIGDKSWGVMVCQNYFGRLSQPSSAFSSDKTVTPSVLPATTMTLSTPGQGNEIGKGGRRNSDIRTEDEHEHSIRGERTLHVGDQFLSAGSNDFKARVVGTTAWIASPSETVELLDELKVLLEESKPRKTM